MAPTLFHSLRSLLPRGEHLSHVGSAGGPLAEADTLRVARTFLQRRDGDEPDEDPARGVLDPHDISNVGIFVLFALIGVAFVLTGIWFFFWAKNGGFHFNDGDWDDYKSTVLRRKGPNGTLLSGATESTNLGGGSVYKDVADVADDDGRTVVTESTGLSGVTAGASDIVAREKRKKKQEQRDRDREQRRRTRGEKSQSRTRHVRDDGIVEDSEAEEKAKKELRNYRHERPARVGGLNKESEGSQWDGSTNPTESTVSSSLLSNQQSTPTNSPTKERRGIRKVYSVAERNDQERARAEARRQQRDDNKIARRDFSYQRSAIGTETESTVTDSLLDNGTDLGTKSYHHPMPELRAQRQREREERRARRGGYRRGRGDEEEEL